MFRVRYRVRMSKEPPDPKHPSLEARIAASINHETGGYLKDSVAEKIQREARVVSHEPPHLSAPPVLS